MRRKEQEITDIPEIESVLNEATVCRIGCAENNEPYIVPVCFGYRDGVLYFHSAAGGKKIAILIRNPRCCVEVDLCWDVIREKNPCKWEMRYKSVIYIGKARIINDPDKKRAGLNCIMSHYGGDAYPFSEIELQRVCVVRIDIEEMTGKKYGF